MDDIPTNWTRVFLAFIAGSAAGVPALLGWLSSRKTHRLVNSRLDALVKLTRKSALARGKVEGRAAERRRAASEEK